MTTYNWSMRSPNEAVVFDPLVDVLFFGAVQGTTGDPSGANVFLNLAGAGSTLSYLGKSVTLLTPYRTLTTSNVTFQNGSRLVVGDNTTGTANDDSANTLVGSSGNDHLLGLSRLRRFTGSCNDEL